jgi:parallel beta-helix repeat protein
MRMRRSSVQALRGPALATLGCAVLAALNPPAAAAIPPTLQGVATATAEDRTLVVRRPAGVKAGDFLVVCIAIKGHPETLRPPGWHLLRRDDITIASGKRLMSQRVFYRFAGADEPRSYLWRLTDSARSAAGILAYRGVERSAPIHTHAGVVGRGARWIGAPKIRTTTPDVLVVGCYGKLGQHPAQPPPPTTERFDIARGGERGLSIVGIDLVAPRPGTAGPSVATSAERTRAVGELIGLTPDSKQDTYYVSPTGVDSGPGTRGRPWKSLQRALDGLHPGHRVIVRRGTYVGPLELRRGGQKDVPVSIEAFEGEKPVIAGRLKISTSHVSVSGFVFDGALAPTPDVLVWVDGGDRVEIRGNEIRNAAESGIFVGSREDPALRVQIVGNWIHDNGKGSTPEDGVHLGYSRLGLIGNNVIEHNGAFGIELFPDGDGTTVIHNTIVSNGRSGVIVAGSASARSDRNVIANNIVAFNAELGLRTSWAAAIGTGNAAKNNIAYENQQGEFGEGPYGAGLVFEPSNRDIDPQFADFSNGSYLLASTSPARDQALASLSLPTDIDGRRRPDGRGPDIGAYEGG